MKLKLDAAKCTGCQACQMACLDQNDISCALGQKALCRIVPQETAGHITLKFIHCIQCGLCAQQCPSGCLHRAEDGLILVNTSLCTGCRACETACPMDVISFSPDTGRVQKCDGCRGRVAAGLLPACVHTCPTGALSVQPES